MHTRLLLCVAAAALVLVGSARTVSARDERLHLPIKAALERPDAAKKLDTEIRLYFANAPHPTAEAELADFKAQKTTRSLGRSDDDACQVAFLSALVALQQHARQVGANAVVGIASYFRDETLTSDTEYVCGAGAVVAGTGLTGTPVRLPVAKK